MIFSRIDRYIARQVVLATAAVVAVIVGLDAIFALMNELDRLRGDYGLGEAIQYIVLRIPRRAYEYIPLSCLIGCLAGLGSMAANSELNVIRAAGISLARISFSVIKPIILIMLVSVITAEYVIPPLERIAQSQRSVALGKSMTQSNYGKGYWHREGQQFMRFTAIEPNGVLYGIAIYQFDEDAILKKITRAERAIYQRNRWQMENIDEQIFTDEKIERVKLVSRQWDTGLTPASLSVVMVEPRDMSISDLFSYTQYLQQQDLNADLYLLSFWKKVTQPLSTLALVMLGLAFIFGPLRSVSPGQRIFSGILVGLVFKYGEELLGPSSIVFGFPPIYASLIPIMLCSIAAYVALRRVG